MPTYSPPWRNCPNHFPADADRCWICQYRGWTEPFMATFLLDTYSWMVDATGAKIDWWIAPWWRLTE